MDDVCSRGELLVEVVYAPPLPALPIACGLAVDVGTTVGEAIEKSGLSARVPGLNIANCKVGVWGRICGPEFLVVDRARIEIYRPLVADPKDARRQRVARKAPDPV